MANIKKKFYVSECIGQCVDGDGEFVDFHGCLTGRYTPTTATKKLRKMYDDITICINKVEETIEVYSMTPEQFREHAELVTE